MYSCITFYSELNNEQLLSISVEVNITTKGDIFYIWYKFSYIATYVSYIVSVYFMQCILFFLITYVYNNVLYRGEVLMGETFAVEVYETHSQ